MATRRRSAARKRPSSKKAWARAMALLRLITQRPSCEAYPAARNLFRVAIAGRMVDHAGGAAARTGGVHAFAERLAFSGEQLVRDRPTDSGRSRRRVHGNGDALVAVVLDHLAERSQIGVFRRVFGRAAGVQRLDLGMIDVVVVVGIAVGESTLGHVSRQADGQRAGRHALARAETAAATEQRQREKGAAHTTPVRPIWTPGPPRSPLGPDNAETAA